MPKITILKTTVSKVKNYNVCEVAYSSDGKTKGMKVLDFLQKDVFNAIKDAQPGDVYDASFEQNNKGYWQFSSVTATGEKAAVAPATSSGSASAGAPARGNWETSDERAARQVLIVRQSCLSTAVDFLGGKKATEEDVIKTAKRFEQYVFEKDQSVVGEVE